MSNRERGGREPLPVAVELMDRLAGALPPVSCVVVAPLPGRLPLARPTAPPRFVRPLRSAGVCLPRPPVLVLSVAFRGVMLAVVGAPGTCCAPPFTPLAGFAGFAALLPPLPRF